jgi:hypothetical protein
VTDNRQRQGNEPQNRPGGNPAQREQGEIPKQHQRDQIPANERGRNPGDMGKGDMGKQGGDIGKKLPGSEPAKPKPGSDMGRGDLGEAGWSKDEDVDIPNRSGERGYEPKS